MEAATGQALAGRGPRDASADAAGRSEAAGERAPSRRLDMATVLSCAGETAFQWDMASDAMAWAPNARQVLGIEMRESLAGGGAFALLIDAKHASQRFDALAVAAKADRGAGAPYRVRFRLHPRGRRDAAALWVEEQGRCYAGGDGLPGFAAGVMRVIDDRHDEEERLRFLSQHDELTGQLNRIALAERVRACLDMLAARRGSAVFIVAAVNNLAHVNDTFGIEVGDEVLCVVGQRLKGCLREGDALGRYASNKFGLIVGDCGPDQVHGVANRLLRAVGDPIVKSASGASVAASVRLGGVLLPQHADSVQNVLGRALEALEWTRSRFDAGFALYAPSEKRESRRRRNIAIAEQVVRALNEGRMLLALQPIVRAEDRSVAFHECLMRMRERDGTLVRAEEFIPVAEQLGLANLIDHRAACLAIELLAASPDLKLGLNVSGETTMGGDWLELVRTLTRGDRSLTGRLTVEITETSAIADIGETVKFVQGVRKLGCRVAIDDFGAGHWSFRALRFLEPDMVKIDGSFIRNLAHSTDDWLFVRALLDLARNFGMETVAEWVEDETTAGLLVEGGITYMQGHYFGAPEPLSTADAEKPREARATTACRGAG